jgi:hypothetical protein
MVDNLRMATWGERVNAATADATAAASTLRAEWRSEQDAETAEAVGEFRHNRTLTFAPRSSPGNVSVR